MNVGVLQLHLPPLQQGLPARAPHHVASREGQGRSHTDL